MKNTPSILSETKIPHCSSEKKRVYSAGLAPRSVNGEVHLSKSSPGLAPCAAEETNELVMVGGPSRLQPIERCVVECIQELSQTNEELRENQLRLTQEAADLKQQLARRNAQVREHIETMDTVLEALAHVLREPVRAINGFAELLQAAQVGVLDESRREHQEYLDRLTGGAARLDRLIQDLIVYGGLNQIELMCEDVSLDTSLCQVVGERAGTIALKGAEVDIQRGLPRVWAHATRLQEVLTRLLDNALMFVAPNVAPRIRIWAEPRPGRVRLWIQDNGIGVPPEHQERIFGLFQRLGEDHPGTGAGLAIVRKGVEQMGGEAGVEPGIEGSRFWIDLRPAQGT
jgi:signal transduction histidine kinase